MSNFAGILRALAGHDVRFVVIGGAAAIVHGAARLTQDVDVVYDRHPDNLEKLVQALAPFAPYLRGAPEGLPFRLDRPTLERGLNFTLTTSLGPLDLLGEVTGGGAYADLEPHSHQVEAFGVRCRCLDLPMLIRTKRAAGRPKDFEAIAELEALLEEREGC
jgi:predicted nucleotidyltransferase